MLDSIGSTLSDALAFECKAQNWRKGTFAEVKKTGEHVINRGMTECDRETKIMQEGKYIEREILTKDMGLVFNFVHCIWQRKHTHTHT